MVNFPPSIFTCPREFLWHFVSACHREWERAYAIHLLSTTNAVRICKAAVPAYRRHVCHEKKKMQRYSTAFNNSNRQARVEAFLKIRATWLDRIVFTFADCHWLMMQPTPLSMLRCDTRIQLMAYENAISIRDDCCSMFVHRAFVLATISTTNAVRCV